MRTVSQVFVRRATPADYEGLGTVFDEAEIFHRQSLPAVFRQPQGRFPSREFFAHMATADDAAVFVAADGEDLVGFIVARVERTADEEILTPRMFATVDLLAVRSDRRREGIGHELMAAAHGWAKERELEHVSLNVWEFNQRAIRFYRAMGYETVSRLMEHPI